MEASAGIVIVLLLVAPIATWTSADAPTLSIVRYDGPIAAEERASLTASGAAILDYAPPFGYVVLLSSSQRASIAANPHIVEIRAVEPIDKLSREVGPQTGAVRALLVPGVDAARFAARLTAEGAPAFPRVVSEPMVDVKLGALPLARLLAHPEIRWVEPAPGPIELDNERASAIVQSGALDAWTLHEQGVNGSTQVVGYCDTGLDTDAPLGLGVGHTVHEMFADAGAPVLQNLPASLHRKVAIYYAPVDAEGIHGDLDDADAHGTHVAGTLAGDAGAWGVRDGHDGVAYASRLAVCDAADANGFDVLDDYAAYWQPAYDAGARVHSNSWGQAAIFDYSLVARQHDAYAWAHRDFLIVRAAGNTGTTGIRPEALAKDVISVGATTSAPGGAVTEFSARGPASDGRIKPDLVAPGDCVTSASIASPTSYVCMRGTSQATPVVAGAATLVRDYFAKGFYPTGSPTPADARSASSALVRAVLVASARPVVAPAPDAAEGWGEPRLDAALPFAGGSTSIVAHDEDAALETDDAWTTTIDAEADAGLRFVLAWTDMPASPGASPTLVNDLDLDVTSPSGTLLLGNADLGAADRTNVIERVLVASAEAGTYTITVRGWNVPMGPQPFALVVVSS